MSTEAQELPEALIIPERQENIIETVPAPLMNADEILAAQQILNLTGADCFEQRKAEAYLVLGNFLSPQFTAKVLVVKTLDSIQKIEVAESVARDIAEDKELPVNERLAACKALALLGEARSAVSENVMALSEKAAAKAKKNPQRNLPPQTIAVQINAPGSSPTVTLKPATNGDAQPEQVESE